MWFGERLQINGPNISLRLLFSRHWKSEMFGFSGGHGGDEYGNCSVYFSCPLFRIVVSPGLCFQRKVELPEPGAHPFIDAMYYPGEDPADWQ